MYDLGVIHALYGTMRFAVRSHGMQLIFTYVFDFYDARIMENVGVSFTSPWGENALDRPLFIPSMYIRSMAFSPFSSLLIQYRGSILDSLVKIDI